MSSRFVLLAVLAFGLASVAVFPALRGFPIYDDEFLPRGSLADSIADVGNTFGRTSLDLRRAVEPTTSGIMGVTYRPTSEATLVLTELASPGGLRLHHAVSWFLHGLTAFLVGVVLVRAGRPAWLAALATGIVAAHPALVEAWVWVAGRADLVAGLCVVAVALAIPADPKRWTRGGLVLGALALLVGTLAKETFVFIGPFVALRGALAPGAPANTRRAAAALMLVPIAALVLIGTKVAPDTRVIPDSADLVAWLRRTPRLIGEATVTVGVPMPRVMRTLSFLTSTKIPTSALVGCAAFGLALALASSRRRAPIALVLLGTAATLCVSAHVADRFWLGFDRFLYAPLVALAILVPESIEQAPIALPRPAYALLAALVVGLTVAAHLAARPYSGQALFEAALRSQRPEDPSGQLLAVRSLVEVGRSARAADRLDRTPRSSSPAVEHERAVLQVMAGEQTAGQQTIENALRVRPTDPFLAADQITISAARGIYSDIARLAELARVRPAARRSACFGLASGRPVADDSAFRTQIDDANELLGCAGIRRH